MPVRRKKKASQQEPPVHSNTCSPHSKGQASNSPKVLNTAEHRPTAKKTFSAKKASIDKTRLTALKENNKCLAAALDESRQEFRKLHIDYVSLQEERHQLLEEIAELKTKESYQNLEKLCIQVQPTYDLLEKAIKNVSSAENNLKGLFQSKAYITGPKNSNSIPASVSPIPAPSNDSQAVVPTVCFEANTGSSDIAEGDTRVYSKTPFPSSTEKCHPKVYSTPVNNEDNGLTVFHPSALDFGDIPLDTSLYDGQADLVDSTCSKRLSELGKPVQSDSRDPSMRRRQIQRPQRKCSTINISYQEPDLKRKLCQGDLHTDVNSQILRSGHVGQSKDRSYSTAHSKRPVLHNITNQK